MRASQGYGDGASASESADTDDDAIFEMELEPAGPAQAVPKGHVHEVGKNFKPTSCRAAPARPATFPCPWCTHIRARCDNG